MQKRGLKVTRVKPESAAEWRAQTEKFTSKMRGSIVPQDILDLTLRERDAYRRRQGHKGTP
jgi:hypothetical protein